ncbi:tripartite tricarboxylate transporter substrate binding protein [Pigmentiphaga sp. NML080357]|uniref:Bug family tripartite tricarboxylate transporter substrate binding protein n=1 Tax=Pigmentiphaga sp. NML080357 TaxID=2008675 RepID=UPI0013037C4C|nr:tripartite tricarboxylate transporter substrate binding protein [Pigmentiphaga sp. NML080357]
MTNRLNSPGRRRALGGLGVAALAAGTGGLTYAQSDYPNRPIRIIVPFSPGAINDVLARTLAERLTPVLKQAVIVENRPGGNTTIGARAVATAEPDGHTLLLISAAHAIGAALTPHALPYDAVRDFSYVSSVARGPFLLIVNKDVSASSVEEFIELAKQRPGFYTFASAGNGSSAHLLGEMLNAMAGIRLLHVPYKGTTPALNDVSAGQVHCTFSTLSGASAALKSGRVRALGVTSARRAMALPEIPAIAEAGYPDYDLAGWWGVLGPANLPASAVKVLNRAVNDVLAQPSLRERLSSDALEPHGSTPEALRSHLEKEIEKYKWVIKQADIKADT